MGRSTQDLIEEVNGESGKFVVLALAVGFEKRTEFVWANDDDKLEKLNELVKSGGEPVGLIGVTLDSNVATVHTRLLEEHQNEDWAQQYLSALVETVGRLVVSTGKAKSFSTDSMGKWIN